MGSEHAKDGRILIVDDQDSNVLLLRRILEREGYAHLRSITDSRSFHQVFSEYQPDLILLDLQMPYVDGYALMEQLKPAVGTQGFLPILVLTADTTPEARQRALSGGASDFLTKPFDPIEVVLRVRNLLDTRFLHRSLKNRNQELEAANGELESFSYSISHDLQAPLRRLNAFAQILREDYAAKLDAQACDHLRRIENAAKSMFEMVDALLSLSRTARRELVRERVDLSALTRTLGEELQQSEPDRIVELVVADGLTADGDRLLMRAAMENLIRNAWKFTRRQPNARVEFGSDGADTPTFFIRDNGAGFDPEHAHRLFCVFQRLHSATDFPGTGIGLATVQRIIRRHGGRIRAEGAVGRGATFYFTLGAGD